MLSPGQYEVINTVLNREFSVISEARKFIAPIDRRNGLKSSQNT